jgi:DNA-binding response OmpR family regulator
MDLGRWGPIPDSIMDLLERSHPAVVVDARFDVDMAARVCRSLRRANDLADVHIVAVTSPDDLKSPSALHKAGADDCWVLDSHGGVLHRSEQSAPRRSLPKPPRVLRSGSFEVDRERYTVTCGGRTVQVTALQMKLLSYLMARPGVVFSYQQLLEEVWADPDGDEGMVRAGIVRLRRVLGKDAALIRNVRGGGYAFTDPAMRG